MSMYDNFRAPQYVDFSSPDDSVDSSSFFEGSLENVSMVPAVGGCRPGQAGAGAGAGPGRFMGADDNAASQSDSPESVFGNASMLSLVGGSCPSSADSTMEADETITPDLDFIESDSEDASMVTAVGGSTGSKRCMEIYDSITPQTEINESDFTDASMATLKGSTPYQTSRIIEACDSASPQIEMNGNNFKSLVESQTPVQNVINRRVCLVSPSTPRLGTSTPLLNKQKLSLSASNQQVKINVIPPTPRGGNSSPSVQTSMIGQSGNDCEVQINIIPATPNCSLRNINNNCIGSSSPKPNCEKTPQGKTCTGKSINRRRSMSESSSLPRSISSEGDVEDMLQAAMNQLVLSCEKRSADVPTEQSFKIRSTKSSSLRQSLANCIKSEQLVKCSRQGTDRPKRKLSPPNKHVRDYSQRPEKFISMAEHIAKIQKQTPPRFRSRCQPVLKKVVVAKTIDTESEEAASSSSAADSSEQGKSDAVTAKPERGVKVARWPAPKVEPFKLTTYKKKEATSNAVKEFTAKSRPIKMGKVAYHLTAPNQFDKIHIGNFGTPMSKPVFHRVTKVEPFSFDHRDQEIIARKVARLKQSEDYKNGVTCSELRHRRRSKSQGAENCKASKGDFHARPARVLYQPPFVPHKPQHVPIKPIAVQLRTELRAKERAEFEKELMEKNQVKDQLRKEQAQKMKEEEERNLAKLRKQLVRKARPAPVFHHFKVHPSCAPLTEPASPSFMHRSRQSAQSHHEHEDDPMDEG